MAKAKDFTHLLGLHGFSDNLLNTHFKLYDGYTVNIEKIENRLKELLASGNSSTPEFAELKRRFGWEFNGVRLHEIYFHNMTKKYRPIDQKSKLYKKMIDDFGSFDNWEKDFKSTGAMRGIGWVILSYDLSTKKLYNVWINEHDVGHLAATAPLLVMDVFEHSFMIDYNIRRVEYIESYFKVISWESVEKMYEKLV